MPQNIRDWLSWLIKLRIVVATTLLGVILGVESASVNADSAAGLFRTTLCIFIVAGLHFALLRLKVNYVGQAYFQILCDLCFTSAIVYFTGGIDSYFPFLYSLSIIMASILLYRKGALITASLCSLMFAGQYVLTQHGVLPSTVYTLIEPRTVRYLIGTNIFAFFAVAYLGSVAALVAVGLFGWSELTRAVILLPGVGMGLVAAPRIAPFINRSRLKWAILIVSSVSAVTLLVR